MNEPEPVPDLYRDLVCPDHYDLGWHSCPWHRAASPVDRPAAESHAPTFSDPVKAVALWAIVVGLTLAAIDTSYKYGTPVPFLVYLAITVAAVPAAVFWARARKANR